MVTLENWRERMSEDMRLRDFRPRTQEGYALAVRQFLDRMQRAPQTLTDEDVRGYFLYLREDKKLAPSSINLAVHALRFFFVHTLHRDWPVFGLLRVQKPRMLPVVLSPGEVRAVLSAVRPAPGRRAAAAEQRRRLGAADGVGTRRQGRARPWRAAAATALVATANVLEDAAPELAIELPVRAAPGHGAATRDDAAEDVHGGTQ